MATWAILRVTPLSKTAVTKPMSSMEKLVRLPKAVPMVVTCSATDWLSNWVRPPAPEFMSMARRWPATPRPADQDACPAPGVEADEPMLITGLVGSANRVVLVVSSRPEGVKATMPVATWPLVRPVPSLMSDAGTARISAYHWFGTELFRKSMARVRLPPLESEIGICISKSGFTPTGVAAVGSYFYIELVAGSLVVAETKNKNKTTTETNKQNNKLSDS